MVELRIPSAATRAFAAVLGWLARTARQATAKALMLGGLIAGSVFAAGVALLTLHLRAQVIEDRARELGGAALMLSAQADSSLQALESVQTSVIEMMRAAAIDTPERLRAVMGSHEIQRTLRDRVAALHYVNAVAILDHTGTLLNVSRTWPPPDLSFADRDYFKALAEDRAVDRYVSEPVLNRVSGDWSFYVARRFDAPDGTLLGIVLGAVNLDYFQRFFHDVALGPDSTISLYRTDGQMLVRHPPADPLASQAQRAVTVRLVMTADQGARQMISPVDGQARLVVVRSLGHYPVALITTRTMDAILAPWRAQARLFAAVAVAVELCLAGLVLLAGRHARRGRLLDQAHGERLAAQERERHNRNLAESYSRFDSAIRSMSQGLCMFDAKDRLIVSNPRLAELFGLAPGSDAPGTALPALARAALRGRHVGKRDLRALHDQVRDSRGTPGRTRIIWDLEDGRAHAVTFEVTPEHGWLMTFEDVSERRRTEARIAHMAHHDALTDLPNRVLLHRRLASALAYAERGGRHALFCLDLDHFKAVNDTLGHPAGDALLREVTARLLRCARSTDTVARLGGDEFAIIQSGLPGPNEAAHLAQRVIEALSKPFLLAGHEVTVGVSIGMAMIPDHGSDPDTLLKHADLALYAAKAAGRGRFAIFEPEMDAVARARLRLEAELRRAVAMEAFQLHYQPIIDMAQGGIRGFEALLRWPASGADQTAPAGPPTPDIFIPIAEESGLIVPLGEWVIRTACAEAASWPNGLRVAVNLSPVQFRSHNLVEAVVSALADAGLEPERLELEITEAVLLKSTAETLKTLHRLRELGVRIAVDDFGTGFSSLSYLRMFPFDKVKIDRSFVHGLGNAEDCGAIVGAVASLCRELGMTSTAEGVETEQQRQAVERSGCNEAQGFLFSRAIPRTAVHELVAASPANPRNAPGLTTAAPPIPAFQTA